MNFALFVLCWFIGYITGWVICHYVFPLIFPRYRKRSRRYMDGR